MMMSRARFRCGGICLIAGLWTASAFAADWPQWLGPARNGTTPETVAPWKKAPAVLWRRAVGNGYSSPVIAGKTVFAHAAVADEDAEEVVALDAQTGQPRWTDTYPRASYRSQLGVGPRATPVVSDGRLFTYGITGVLSCYDVATGKRLWQTNPYETNKVSLPGFGVCSSPVVVAGRVVVLVGGGGSAVVAYDALTGKISWKGLDEPASSASPIALVRGEGKDRRTEVVVQTTLRIAGLNPETGAIRWEHPLVFQPAGVSPTPLVLGESLVCTTQETGTMSLKIPTGDTRSLRPVWWKQDLNSYFSTGTIGPPDSVLVITNQQSPLPRADLRCLDLASGNELWLRKGVGYFHAGVLATGDGKLLFLDDSGSLILAEISRKEFKQLSKSSVCRGTLINPAFSDGRFVARDDKELVCVQLESVEPVNKSPATK